MVVAEAAQRLRLPLISKDGEVREDEIEKCSIMSRSSLDSTSTSVTISSSSNSTSFTTPSNAASAANSNLSGSTDTESGVGGVPNRFLGITPAYLWQTQLQQNPLPMVRKQWTRCCYLLLAVCIRIFLDVIGLCKVDNFSF